MRNSMYSIIFSPLFISNSVPAIFSLTLQLQFALQIPKLPVQTLAVVVVVVVVVLFALEVVVQSFVFH